MGKHYEKHFFMILYIWSLKAPLNLVSQILMDLFLTLYNKGWMKISPFVCYDKNNSITFWNYMREHIVFLILLLFIFFAWGSPLFWTWKTMLFFAMLHNLTFNHKIIAKSTVLLLHVSLIKKPAWMRTHGPCFTWKRFVVCNKTQKKNENFMHFSCHAWLLCI